MLSKKEIETIIHETQIKEKLNSPRQVLEKYPDLNAIYTMACTIEASNIPYTSETEEAEQTE